MKPDPLVLKRFEELIERATELNRNERRLTSADGKFWIKHGPYQQWATSAQSALLHAMGEDSPHYRNFLAAQPRSNGYCEGFESQVGILRAVKEDLAGGYLFKLRGLAKVEVLTDAHEQAAELLSKGYKDPACVIARVILELTLKEISSRKGLPIGKVDKMNADLCKAGVYNMARQKQITAWAELGNRAAHGEWDAYGKDQVEAFLDGTQRFVTDHL